MSSFVIICQQPEDFAMFHNLYEVLWGPAEFCEVLRGSVRFHKILWCSIGFYNIPVNQSVPTEVYRGLTSYIELCANYLWILLEYSLLVFCSIECHFKLVWTCYEPLSSVFANWLTTMHIQYFISYICYLAQLGCKSLQIKVEDILDNCLLFGCSELMLGVAIFRAV
jgi:hypothetical protein